MHGERERDVAQPGDRLEISDRIVGELLEQVLVGGMRRVAGDEHGMPVGRSARHVRRRGLAAGARDVLDDDRPALRGIELLAQDARKRIGRAAGGERDDELDRPRRKILRRRRCRNEHRRRQHAGDGSMHELHGSLLPWAGCTLVFVRQQPELDDRMIRDMVNG